MKDITQGRPGRAAQSEPPAHAPNAALLIDFDNVTMGIRSDLQNRLRRLLNSEMIKGKVAVQRAYADWRRYPQYIVPLSEASIDLIFAPAFGSNKKNATDIRLAIDALELVFTRPEIGTFILLSGDSDFSSLVLKLKEYGKYVVGVGIRESSSDLLVQNCDEYFSYNEITGLTKERDVEHVRRDPWELVVEAVRQMKQDDDVMRSDRLKQVMQDLDPNFNEKDAGFNRFSKFVVEASHRGLLSLKKMENGQYAVDLGTNANVPPGEEVEDAAERAARGRRKRSARRREPESARGLTLAEAFELLRQALLVLGAVGEESTNADQVREKMIELVGDAADPVFERPRFQRLLRQAHDADLIELIKQDGDVYMLRLGPDALMGEVQVALPTPPVGAPREATPKGAEGSETQAPPARRRGARPASKGGQSAKARRPARSRKTEDKKDEAPNKKRQDDDGGRTSARPAGPVRAEAGPQSATPKRSPRYRRGSRGGAPTASSGDAGDVPESKALGRTTSSGARSLGPRRGSRGAARTAPASGSSATTRAAAPDEAAPPARAAPREAAEADQPIARDEGPFFEERDAAGGLLKRMTAALQKVMKSVDADDADR